MATRWYRAPELLLRSTSYDQKIDIFALGCMAVELYTGKPLAAGFNEVDQIGKLFSVLGPPPENWGEGLALASKLRILFPSGSHQPYVLPQASPAA